MALKKKQEDDEAPGAPEWMVTFSDCMTLLLTFFVLLLTFSSFDNKVFKKLKTIYSTGLSSIVPINRSARDSLEYLEPIIENDIDKGSEHPTLLETQIEGLRKSSGSTNLDQSIALVLPSNEIFWGNGSAISIEGRQTIDQIAILLNEVSHRIVIAENSTDNNTNNQELGLQRAFAIVKYLTETHNLKNNRFSISTGRMTGQKNASNQTSETFSSAEPTRNIEIVLLTRSIYN